MDTFKVLKIKGTSKEIIDDIVIEEVPLTLILGEKELATILCMPSSLKELITGFLFTSGMIRQAADIKNIIISQEQWAAYIDLVNPDIAQDLIFKRLYTSGCGRGILFYNVPDLINRTKIVSDYKIEVQKINALMLEFQNKSDTYLKTGGVHSSALADDEGILIFEEDIGRHNAIDKVIGKKLNEGGDFKNKIIITSGRISSEVLFKIQKCRIPVVISRSAPTNQAVKLAKDMGITLIGFARGNRMNVYSFEERIIV